MVMAIRKRFTWSVEDFEDTIEVECDNDTTHQEDTGGEEESAYNEHFKHSELRAGPGVS